MNKQPPSRLYSRNFIWAWLVAVNASFLVATFWVGVVGLLEPLNLLRVGDWFSDQLSWAVEAAPWLANVAIALALTFAGELIVKAYSRRRESREDVLPLLRLVGQKPMIVALTTIAKGDAMIPRGQLAYAARKIAGRSRWGEFLSIHSTLGDRVTALRGLMPEVQA